MKRPLARVIGAAALLTAALTQPQRAQSIDIGEAPAYEVRYLLGLGGTHSRGNSINNDGWIAGYSHLDASYRHAALWLGETPLDLGALGSKNKPKNSNVVWPVKNTRGLIVGISQTDSPDPWGENWSCSAFFPLGTDTGSRCVGFAWENGAMRALPTLGGTHGFAAAANNLGPRLLSDRVFALRRAAARNAASPERRRLRAITPSSAATARRPPETCWLSEGRSRGHSASGQGLR
jgi:hypothetical protein